jgi:plasmid stabilization system protein ParE
MLEVQLTSAYTHQGISVAVRKSLLVQYPLFLPSLLDEAQAAEANETSHTRLCTTLLSSPLPSECPIPAAAPNLLDRCLQRASREPCIATVQPLYLMMEGVGRGLLAMLSHNSVRDFQRTMLRILKEQQDHRVQLLCLAIAACLAEAHCDITGANPHASEGESNERSVNQNLLQPSFQLFGTSRADKTLKLAILRAILCSTACSDATVEPCGCLTLVARTLHAFDSKHIKTWVVTNPGLVQKLCGRASRQDMEPQTRAIVTGIVNQLIGPHCTSQLLGPRFDYPCVPLRSLNPRLATTLATSSNSIALAAYLKKISTLFSNSQVTSDQHLELENARCFVLQLQRATHDDPNNRSALLCAMATSELKGALQFIFGAHEPVATNNSPQSHSPEFGCSRSLSIGIGQLRRDLSSLLLSTMIAGELNTSAVDSDGALRLVRILHETTVQTACQMVWPQAIDATTLFCSMGSSSDQSNASRNWRETLERELVTEGQNRAQRILKQVGSICRDLEARCEQIEAPIHEHEELVAALKQQLLDAQSITAVTNQDLATRDSHIGSLRRDQADMQHRLDISRTRIKELELELADVQTRAVTAAETAREEAEQEKLENMTTLVVRDESIEAHKKTVDALTTDVRALQEKNQQYEQLLSSVEQVRDRHHVLYEQAKNHAEGLLISINMHTKDLAAQEAEAAVLKETISRLESKIQEMQRMQEEHFSREENHRRCVLELEQLVAQVRLDSASVLAQSERKSKETLEELERTTQSLKQQLNMTAIDADQRQQKSLRLQRKVEALEKEKEEGASDLAEAQRLKKRLLAIVGDDKEHQPQTSEASQALRKSRRQRSNGLLEMSCNKHSAFKPSLQKRSTRVVDSSSRSPTKPRREPLADLGTSFQTPANTSRWSNTVGKLTDVREPPGGKLTSTDDYGDLSFTEDMDCTIMSMAGPTDNGTQHANR